MATGPISNRKWLLNLCVWQVGPRAPVWSIFWTGKASQWWRTAMHSSTISRGIWWSGLNYTCQLAECCKRQLNQGSFVLLYFRLFTFSDLYWVCLFVFSCTVLFVSISQVIGCGPVWAWGRCRISPPRFLAECCKRQLNQVSFVFAVF